MVAIPSSPRFVVWNHWLASSTATLLAEGSDNEFDVDTIFLRFLLSARRVYLEELSVLRCQLATILFTHVVVHRLPFGKSVFCFLG